MLILIQKELLNHPFAYEQAMYDAIIQTLKSSKQHFPYESNTYNSVRTTLNNLMRYGSLSGDMINQIHRDILVHSLNNEENSNFNGDNNMSYTEGNATINTTVRQYYNNVFPKHLFDEIQSNPELKK